MKHIIHIPRSSTHHGPPTTTSFIPTSCKQYPYRCQHPLTYTSIGGHRIADHPLILIFHGAEVFDHGDAARLITLLLPQTSYVAGIMARTAAEESGLSVIYDGRKPSEILSEHPANHAILVHRAKTPASAQRFGSLIHAHCHGRGLILIDPGTCQILTWDPVDTTLCSWLSWKTGYPLLPGEQHQKTPPHTRIIAGCLPGEPVFVNGIIIGYATAEKVEIFMQDGTIHARSGIKLKHHGIEKLLRFGCPDLANAWCKSGTIRTTRPKKRERSVQKGRIAVIDHTAIACYTICDPHTCGIVTIGDDTTSICGHIGCSRGIPVLGITDGDLDGIIADGYALGSIVLRTVSERDDDLGIEIMRMIPDEDVVWNEWVETIIAYLGERVRIVHREDE